MVVDSSLTGFNDYMAAAVTRDESQDYVGGLLEWGLLTCCEIGPFFIFLIRFNLVEGFWGGSKPQKHYIGKKGKLGVRKQWVADHRKVEARLL